MSVKLYRFAGLDFALFLPAERMYEGEFWLEPFQTDRVDVPHRYTFRMAEEMPRPEGVCISNGGNGCTFECGGLRMRYLGPDSRTPENANLCVIHNGMEHSVHLNSQIYRGRLNVSTVLDALDINHLILDHSGVILHASYIAWEGKAVLFTAPCRTGKSTQAQLWADLRNARIMNGDRAVVRLDRDRVLAEGLPFCGTSQYSCNSSLPLAAIVYLGQAPVTTIRKLRGYEAFARVWEGVTVDPGNKVDLERASETVEAIVGRVPVYHMPCTPDEDAVRVLEQVLRNQGEL